MFPSECGRARLGLDAIPWAALISVGYPTALPMVEGFIDLNLEDRLKIIAEPVLDGLHQFTGVRHDGARRAREQQPTPSE
jgi:hypothetical protein